MLGEMFETFWTSFVIGAWVMMVVVVGIAIMAARPKRTYKHKRK